MSRPRYLADNDLNDAIVVGIIRREPAAEFARLRDLGSATWSDPEVLDFAAAENWIVVSHDVNTMRDAAYNRLEAGLLMKGLLLASQRTSVSSIIARACFSSGPRVTRRNGLARSNSCRFDAFADVHFRLLSSATPAGSLVIASNPIPGVGIVRGRAASRARSVALGLGIDLATRLRAT